MKKKTHVVVMDTALCGLKDPKERLIMVIIISPTIDELPEIQHSLCKSCKKKHWSRILQARMKDELDHLESAQRRIGDIILSQRVIERILRNEELLHRLFKGKDLSKVLCKKLNLRYKGQNC